MHAFTLAFNDEEAERRYCVEQFQTSYTPLIVFMLLLIVLTASIDVVAQDQVVNNVNAFIKVPAVIGLITFRTCLHRMED